MQQIGIKEIHEVQIEILKRIDQICSDLKIDYFAMYGTLLGCVRHNGFIPWDDDVDIGMLRKDYETFCNYFRNNNMEDIYLDNALDNKKYPFYIPRVCEKKHVLIFNQFGFQSGIFVDIYPIDSMGNESDVSWWIKENKRIYHFQKGILFSNVKCLWGKNIVNKLLNIPFSNFSKMVGNKYFYKKIDQYKNSFSWEESSLVGVPCWMGTKNKYNKDSFSTAIRHPFESISIKIPIGYDSILKENYGDYMTPPDKDKQIAHHEYTAYRL